MKVFLRHVRTGHYYNGNNEWVAEQEDANDYRTIEESCQMITRDMLDGMSVVVSHDKTGTEQVFDLTGHLAAVPPRNR